MTTTTTTDSLKLLENTATATINNFIYKVQEFVISFKGEQ